MAGPATADTNLVTYTDEADKFSLQVPEGWELLVPQEKFDRFRTGVSSNRTLAWVAPGGTDVNVTMVITTPGSDYVSLGSFGSADVFGANLVASMDRSFMLRGISKPPSDVMVCKLVGTRSSGDMYFVEYTTKRGDDPQKHLYSAVALGTNSRTRRFYTVTATCPESKLEEVRSTLIASVNSLQLTGSSRLV